MRSLLLVSDINDFSAGSKAHAGLMSGADILVLDLANPPDDARQTAFAGACDFIRAARSQKARPRLYVRVPVLDDPTAIAVLGAAIGAGADGIVLPDTLGGHDVTRLDARISVEEAVHAVDHGCVKIIAEAAGTARAAMGLATFRGASHRLTGLVWSAERLAADLGGITTMAPDGTLRAPLAWARGQFLVATAATGVTAIVDASLTGPGILPFHMAARDDGFGAGLTRDAADISEIARIMAGAKG